ncbi:MAG: EamA family transporter [Dehalobacterium sp.]
MKHRDISEFTAKTFVILAAIIWGTMGTAQKFAPPGTSPLAVGAIRIIIGGLILLVISLFQGLLKIPRNMLLKPPVLMAALGISVCQLVFFAAVAKTGVAVGTVVSIGSGPIMAGLLGYLFRGEKVGIRWGISTTLAVLGCFFLVATKNNSTVDIFGIFLALITGLGYATYAISSKILAQENYPKEIISVVFCLSALFLSPVLFLTDLSWLVTIRGGAIALYMGVITGGLAFVLFTRGLSRIPIATAVTLAMAEPLTASILGIVVIKESLSFLGYCGLLLLFSGIIILSLAPANQTVLKKQQAMPEIKEQSQNRPHSLS